MREAILWSIVVTAIGLPLIFRTRWWPRVLGVSLLWLITAAAWGEVQMSARDAAESAYKIGGRSDEFVRGAIAARDAALLMSRECWAAVAGVSVLALVPMKKRQ